MKKFKYLLLAVVAMVLCSCGASVDELAEQIRDEMEVSLEKELGVDVHVGEVILVHKGGNEYTSIVEVTAEGETVKLSLEVVYDGESYQWELYE